MVGVWKSGPESQTGVSDNVGRVKQLLNTLRLDDVGKISINAMTSAFLPYDQRCDLIYKVLKPGYARIRQQQSTSSSGPRQST